MTNATLLLNLGQVFSHALPPGMSLEVDGARYLIRGKGVVADHAYPDELAPELLTTLFLDSIQAAVADIVGEHWPQLGGVPLRYEVQASERQPLIRFLLLNSDLSVDA